MRPVFLPLAFLLAAVPASAYNVTMMKADLDRPWIYAVHHSTTGGTDSLLFVSTSTAQVEKALPIGTNVTDIALNPFEGRLYVANWGQATTRVVNVVTQAALPSLSLGTDVYRVNTGGAGRIFTEGYDQWVNLSWLYSATGTVATSTYVREGDGESSPDGLTYYHCDNNISNASIHRYDMTGGTFQPAGTSREHPYGSRRLIMSGDGSRLFWQRYVYDAALTELGDLGQTIVATTLRGTIAFSSTSAINTTNGQVVYTLPTPSSVMAVTGDQDTLVLFDPNTGGFQAIPMSLIAPVPGPGLNPSPANGTTVSLPLTKLAWDISPTATSYEVYFGTDSARVATAVHATPEYLGTTNSTSKALTAPLASGQDYFWRVDIAGFSGLRRGETWRFTVSPLLVTPNEVSIAMVTGAPIPDVMLTVTAATSESWSVTHSQPWLSIERASGSTPDTLRLHIDASSLTGGVHTDSLWFSNGTVSFSVPVTITLFQAQVTRMVSDLVRPWIYALHPGSGTQADAYLLFVSTTSGQVERAIPIGRNPTDLAVNYPEHRLYVTNHGQPTTRVVNLDTQQELAPLALGTDVFRLNASRAGRIHTEGYDQWVSLRTMSTSNGAVLGSVGIRQGDGEASPNGTTYYHCDDNISNASIHRYSLATDTPSELGTSPEHPYGSRSLVMSGDGTRLFWQGYVYDAALTEIGYLGAQIVASALHGTLAFSTSQAYDVVKGVAVYTLPYPASALAVAGDQSRVVLFDPSVNRFRSIPMSSIASVPGPGLEPSPANGGVAVAPLARLRWNVNPFATSYETYLGQDSVAVMAAGHGSPEYLGAAAANERALVAALQPGGRYYWRVDVVDYDGIHHGELLRFDVAPLQITPNPIDALMATGAPVPPKSVIIGALTNVAWTVTKSQPWLILDHASGTAPDTLRLSFDTTSLAAGVWQDTLRFSASGSDFQVPVTLTLFDLNVTKMLPDYERPWVYALQRGSGTSPDSYLAFVNTNTEQIEKVIPIGINATDMAVHAADGRLYVTNHGRPVTRVVNLDTQQEVAPLSLGSDVYKISAGRAGRIYTEELDQWIDVRTINSITGAVLATTFMREGDGESSPDGLVYYHCDNNISNASIHRYNATADALVQTGTSPEHPYGSRQLIVSGDGSRVFWQSWIYDASLTEIGVLPSNIVATTLRGTVAFTSSAAYATASGSLMYPLPYTSGVMAVSGDQQKLLVYDATGRTIRSIPMSDIGPVPGPGLNPVPANGAVVVAPLAELAWDPSPIATGYEVYFGSDSAAVDAAGPSSPEYRGSTTSTRIAQGQNLALGQGYYWRVDIVGFTGTRHGAVWKFTVAPIRVAPRSLAVRMVTRAPVPVQRLVLTAESALGWSLTHGQPWLSVDRTTGSTPDTLRLAFDTSGLPGGVYADTLRLTTGALAFEVPVSLTLFDLRVTKMITDYERPYVYALHPGSGTFADAFLAFINTNTEQVEKVIPIGTNPTDMALHTAEGRLYVTNWGQPVTRVVDLSTQQELNPLVLGTDVYKINAGRYGRIHVEEEDQWVQLRTINTTTGAVVFSSSVREGDGESSPSGEVYYHCDNNISNASIHRYNATTDALQQTGTSAQHAYGSRQLVLSGDGTRLFWQRWAYDAALTETGTFAEDIVATTLHGTVAFSATQAYDASSGLPLYTMPYTSGVMAASGDQTKLFVFDATTAWVRTIAMSDIAIVPGPGLNPVPPDRSVVPFPVSRLSWDISPVATRYEVYFGTDSIAVAVAGHSAPEYRGSTVSTSLPVAQPLTLGQSYFWRVDVVAFSGLRRGGVLQFTVSAIRVSPSAVSISMPAYAPVADARIAIDASTPTAWSVASSAPWLSLSVTNGSTPDTLLLHFNTTLLPAGLLADTLRFTAAGKTFGVPVQVSLFDLNVTHIVADPARPYVYALHPGSGTFSDAYLAFVNTYTEDIEKVIPIGTNPTDMALSIAEGRLYVTNWGQPLTRVVDLNTQSEIAPLALGNDVYKINAGRAGRVYTEGYDQWVSMRGIDSGTGGVVSTASVREGDGECSPTGAYYYHCDNNISNASIHRYNAAVDPPVESNTSQEHPYGSRRLVLSGDGTRLFWQSYMFDAALNQLRDFGEPIYATSVHGLLAFGAQNVFNTQTGAIVHTLPFAATVMAVSGDQGKLFAFRVATHTIQAVQFDVLVPTLDADLRLLSAEMAGDAVELTWNMDRWSEVIGFNLYRASGDDSQFERLNASPIPAAATTTWRDSSITLGERYRYRVGAIRTTGEGLSAPIELMTPTQQFAMQATPNPSAGPMRLVLSLPRAASTRFDVFDLNGRRVRSIQPGILSAGIHSIEWNGRSDNGSLLANGVYFCRVEADERSVTKRIVIAR